MNVTVSFSYYSAGTGANFEIDMTEEDLSCDDDLLCIIDDKVKEQWYAKILKEDVVVKDWFYIDQVSETEVVVYTEAYGEEWRIPHVDGVIKWADLNDDQQIHLSTTMWESKQLLTVVRTGCSY